MTQLKKIFILLSLFLFFLSCGYTPIFSKQDVNFSIENIEFLGDKDVKKKLVTHFPVIGIKPIKEKKYH